MRNRLTPAWGRALLAVWVLSALHAAETSAQSSSLFGQPDPRRPFTLANYSWTYQPPPEPHPFRLHDVILVDVSEIAVVTSEGEIDRKKKAHGELVLKDWILLKGLHAFPDPQGLGDPKIRGEVDNKVRAEGSLETRDSMKFKISCMVVDVRPNGNLIVEGHDEIRNNSEVWQYSFSGEVRPEDVGPDNTVLSRNVAHKRIYKREAGHVRDGYRRGWLQAILDKYQPF